VLTRWRGTGKKYWTCWADQGVTGSGLDLEPETERGHEAAHGAPYMSRLHEVSRSGPICGYGYGCVSPGHAANRQCPLGPAPAPVPRPGGIRLVRSLAAAGWYLEGRVAPPPPPAQGAAYTPPGRTAAPCMSSMFRLVADWANLPHYKCVGFWQLLHWLQYPASPTY
jgi:hypothetical protein